MKYDVLLKDGTTGTIDDETFEGVHPDEFVGEVVRIKLHDENGNLIEAEGELSEVL